ncbi:MAG: DUF3352 domain-containing protein [Pirellula sp.]
MPTLRSYMLFRAKMYSFLLIALGIGLANCSVAFAQRPTAPRLFPEKTLVYVRVDDTRELKNKLSQTSMGKLSEDPQLKPIIGTFYSTFNSLVQGMQNAIGVNLDELLSIPNGELAVALVPSKTNPILCGMIEAGDELPAVELMIGRLDARLVQQGAEKTTKEIGKIKVTQFRNAARQGRQLGFFTDSGVLVFASDPEYAESLALTWQGSGIDHKPLSDNRDFTTIMSKCVGAAGERPQASFFVNPIAIYRESSKENASTLVVLAALKALGIDGIKGIGGSAIIAPNDFDSIVHAHLLLENNRRGVLRAIRPKTGSTAPESWVHDQVVSYGTLNWDIAKTVKAVAEIVDTFGGENAFENNVVDNVNRQLGIDIRKDFLDLLDNRISLAQVIIPPKRINSQSNLFGIHVNDPKRMKTEVLPKLFEKLSSRDSRWTSKQVGDSTVYWLEFKNERPTVRAPQPAFCMLGSDILASDSIDSIEQAIRTESSGEDLLGDAIEYKLVRDRIKAQLKDKESSIMFYQRPEESLRLFYDLASDRENVDRLEQVAANNPFFQALVTALKSRQLPPFEVIAKYTAPSGAFVFEEEDGLHYTAFNMRRE